MDTSMCVSRTPFDVDFLTGNYVIPEATVSLDLLPKDAIMIGLIHRRY